MVTEYSEEEFNLFRALEKKYTKRAIEIAEAVASIQKKCFFEDREVEGWNDAAEIMVITEEYSHGDRDGSVISFPPEYLWSPEFLEEAKREAEKQYLAEIERKKVEREELKRKDLARRRSLYESLKKEFEL